MSKKSAAKAKPAASPATEYELAEEFRQRAQEYHKLYMSTPEKARKTLHRIGILTKAGKLTEPYR